MERCDRPGHVRELLGRERAPPRPCSAGMPFLSSWSEYLGSSLPFTTRDSAKTFHTYMLSLDGEV